MKKPYKIDIAVLILFFCRDQKLKEVFDAVKKARPSRLYLYQDGARAGNEKDKIGIAKCREIVSAVDWNCEVFTNYQDKNWGCDPSEYLAQKWFFSHEEMGIVLEDDDVPSQSFFSFCKELLDRYKNDERINIICGMNNNDMTPEVKESYFFAKTGSIWGWASWRRVIDTWDETYSWLDDGKRIDIMRNNSMKYGSFDRFLNTAQRHRASKRAHYESIMGASAMLYNRFNIVPKYNMIKNIGIDEVSTHSVADIRLLPKRTQRLLYKKIYEIDFPLIHPNEVKENFEFERKMTPTKFQTYCDRIEHIFRVLIYSGPKVFAQKVHKKFRKK